MANAVGHPLKGPELVLRIWESTAGAICKEVESGRYSSSSMLSHVVPSNHWGPSPRIGFGCCGLGMFIVMYTVYPNPWKIFGSKLMVSFQSLNWVNLAGTRQYGIWQSQIIQASQLREYLCTGPWHLRKYRGWDHLRTFGGVRANSRPPGRGILRWGQVPLAVRIATWDCDCELHVVYIYIIIYIPSGYD